jgi:hypothetical protein
MAVVALAFGGYRLAGLALSGNPEPDLGAFASSAVVRTDDAVASRWLGQQARRLATRAGWLSPAGHGMTDECAGTGGDGGMFAGGMGVSVSCQRTDTWFFEAARGRPASIRRLERVLHRAGGWGRFATSPAGPASPPVLPVISAAWTGPAGPRPRAGKVALMLIWVQGKDQLAAAALGAQQTQVAADRVRYLHILRPDLKAVARRSFGRQHHHVLVVSFGDTYFSSHAISPPDPPSRDRRGR